MVLAKSKRERKKGGLVRVELASPIKLVLSTHVLCL